MLVFSRPLIHVKVCKPFSCEDGRTGLEVSGEGSPGKLRFLPLRGQLMGSPTRCLINTQTEAASGSKGLCLHFQKAQPSEFGAEPRSGLADGLCPP